jgi:hypothetical protein
MLRHQTERVALIENLDKLVVEANLLRVLKSFCDKSEHVS